MTMRLAALRGVSAMTRRYPLKSGHLTVGNKRPFRALAGDEPWRLVAKLHNGSRVHVLNDFVGRATLFVGDLDRKVSWTAQRALRPGDVFLDVGANIGVVSMYAAAAVGPSGAVHSFEPQKNLAGMIEESARLNGFTNVTVHPVGLSDQDATLQLHVPADNPGAASLESDRPWERTALAVEVREATAYLSALRLPHVRVMKIDIEGHEGTFLGAARGFFAATPPDVVIFEEQERPATDALPVRLLSEYGYDVFGLPHAKLRLHPELLTAANASDFHDMIAVHKQVIDRADLLASLGVRAA